MSDEPEPKRLPAQGWSLGADGFPKALWVFMAVLLWGIGLGLLMSGYVGYGGMLVVLGVAAAVNVLP
ncbi:MAG: hypothetical protein KDC33_00615 [Thermoleophilia bacterium]|nr:hypothetical protein [Thermoleophilia bacterium]